MRSSLLNSITSKPVITFLAPSENASLRARDALCKYFGATEMNQQMIDDGDIGSYNSFHKLFSSKSVTLGLNGAYLQLISLSNDSLDYGDLSLISITQVKETPSGRSTLQTKENLNSFLNEKHDNIMYIKAKLYALRLLRRNSYDAATQASSILFGKNEQMLLDLPKVLKQDSGPVGDEEIDDIKNKTNLKVNSKTNRLKEVVIPFFPSLSESENSIGDKFSASGLDRPLNSMTGYPMPGLYAWPISSENDKSIYFRPIPAALEDRSLPCPSLIFQSEVSLEEKEEELSSSSAIITKVGFSGGSFKGRDFQSSGQLSIGHSDLPGIDLRFCSAQTLSVQFPEAQEALFASSLVELQNANVMAEGGRKSKRNVDKMNGMGDCWVEFRANMKHPAGFLGNKRNSSKARIAKSPNLPYS